MESRLRARVQQWFKPFLEEKAPIATSKRYCINFNANQLVLVAIDRTSPSNPIELLAAETFKLSDVKDVGLILAGAVKKYGLEDVPTSWLLSPDDYQLFLIESLPVQKDEFQEALNWRLRSLINYPVDEAAVDRFNIPPKKATPNNPMVAAVTAKKKFLRDTLAIFKKSGVNVVTIDIPELAMRNLSALCENDEKSTGFIYFYEHSAILNITREKTLYFTRRINMSNEGNATLKEHEQLSLDVLRYFDYFQSQWRYPSPTRIVFAAQQEVPPTLEKSLSDLLLASVQPYQFPSGIFNPNEKISLTNNMLLTLGGVMREGN